VVSISKNIDGRVFIVADEVMKPLRKSKWWESHIYTKTEYRHGMDVSVVLPCRNEEKALGACIRDIRDAMDGGGLVYEIIVSDSSTDTSSMLAEALGVRVVKHDKAGYGNAILEGVKEAHGVYVFFADADCSYDFKEIPRFIKSLKDGHDLVVGDRFKGDMADDAMPWLHRHIGNPMLSAIFRLLFNVKVHDTHSGMRAIRRDTLEKLCLRAAGMEFATEMLIKAAQEGLRVGELPIHYRRRVGESKLRSFTDGWRHLRFMLMYAPDMLFMAPGLVLSLSGTAIIAALSVQPHATSSPLSLLMLLGCSLVVLGYQIISMGAYSKAYMKSTGFLRSDGLVEFMAKIASFESAVTLGAAMVAVSLLGGILIIVKWGMLGVPGMEQNAIFPIITLAVLGAQTLFNAFYMSVLLVEKR
jgi:hypothetical protein